MRLTKDETISLDTPVCDGEGCFAVDCDCKPYQASEFPCVDEEQEARADYLVSVHVEESRMEEG